MCPILIAAERKTTKKNSNTTIFNFLHTRKNQAKAVWYDPINIDKMFHSSNKSRVNQGENLYYSFKTENGLKVYSKTPAKDASASWYNEINEYTYSPIGSPLNKSVVIGHYTQMVWKTTTKVGMAKARSSSGKEYIVARYAPGGNYIGDYPY